MFLVDDDEAEPGIGANTARRVPSTRSGSPSAAAAHARRRAAAGSRLCSVTVRSAGQRARDTCLELRRQVDLGHEQERLAPGGNGCRRRRKVDLGLAAARDAVENERREGPVCGDDRGGGAHLIRVEIDGGLSGLCSRVRGGSGCGRHPRRDAAGAPQRRHHLSEREAERLLVVTRDKSTKVEQIVRQRQQVGDLADGAQALPRDCRCLRDLHDDPGEQPTAEADSDNRSSLERKPRGHPVVECG